MAGDGLTAATRRRRTVKLPSGKEIELEAIGVRDYAQVREQACAEYKRSLLKTVKDNLDLMPEADRATAMDKAFERAMALTPDDLPTKKIKDPATGKERDVPYTDWWMGMTVPGVLYSVWLSMRKCPNQSGLTLADIEKMFEDQWETLHEAGDELADLSRPRLGNSDPAAVQAGMTSSVA